MQLLHHTLQGSSCFFGLHFSVGRNAALPPDRSFALPLSVCPYSDSCCVPFPGLKLEQVGVSVASLFESLGEGAFTEATLFKNLYQA